MIEFLENTYNSLFNSTFAYYAHAVNIISLVCWILTLLTENYSQVDRLWPVMPAVYGWCFVYSASNAAQPDANVIERLKLVACLITLWSLRLTYHFYVKGYYKWDHQDYRWPIVRKKYGYPDRKVKFHIFNFIFLGFIQNWLLFSLDLPLWYIQSTPFARTPVNTFDYILCGSFVFFAIYEVIGDLQQLKFQTNKHDWLKNKNSSKYSKQEIADFERGFMIRGLFRFSRHPNYFGDLGVWWTVYLFTVSSQFTTLDKFNVLSLFNYPLAAIIFFTLIFQLSTSTTEKISSSKYKEYKEYQRQVRKIIPLSNYKSASDNNKRQ